ncbi:MAG: pyruvate kinase [Holosporaceae bacterium]|jgi:pyruvate kinase|nr:pyruvate kinase [Holosporaceae bacterium]
MKGYRFNKELASGEVMRTDRLGKIIATIGPATATDEMIEKAYLRGVDVFRLNFSHGSQEDHKKTYLAIRNLGKKYGTFPTILADLQGPKLRIGTFMGNEIMLEVGEIFSLDMDSDPGNNKRVCFPHKEVFQALRPGSLLLLDDGKLKMEIISCDGKRLGARVLVGGRLSNRKGVSIPNLKLPISNLTDKDLRDLEFSLKLGVDWIVLSLVQSVEDVVRAKGIIENRAGVMTKLEKPLAIQSLEPIVEASDAVMVARGDLGVEMDQEELPAIQRRVLEVGHRLGRPVVVATQMLESMIFSPVPTRAEVSDVANAVYQGADATMLSAESASGQYPLEAIAMMSKVIQKTEADPSILKYQEQEARLPLPMVSDAICAAAKEAAEYSRAQVIMLFTDSFDMILRCSRMRPSVPIIAVAASESFASRCGVCRGVFSLVSKREFGEEQMCKIAKFVVAERKFATAGDNIVVVNDISGSSVHICSL